MRAQPISALSTERAAKLKPTLPGPRFPTIPARRPPHSPCASGRRLRERLRGALFLFGSALRRSCLAPVCTRLPQGIRLSLIVLDPSEDEEQVREAIHVADHGWSNRLLETDLNDLPLGSTHCRSGNVEQGRTLRAARQHKRRERLQLRVLSIEHLLQPSHLILSHPQRLFRPERSGRQRSAPM